MSLAAHLSAYEGLDREPDVVDYDDAGSLTLSRVPSRQRRTSISYDPVPITGLDQETKKLEPVAAYEVSVERRIGGWIPIICEAAKHSYLRSTGTCRSHFLCPWIWHCFRICGAEADFGR
jgi:hypothetical protein